MLKTKILVLGPCESGKTVISNFLADATETGGNYHPTQGCRILEFEVHNIQSSDDRRSVNAEIELWDVSGDRKFESCWPVIAREANGVIFVYNPDQPNHDKELETWHSYFVEAHSMRDAQCVVFAHHKDSSQGDEPPQLSSSMERVRCVHTNLEDEGETLRDEFKTYLGDLLAAMTDKRESEELSILNS